MMKKSKSIGTQTSQKTGLTVIELMPVAITLIILNIPLAFVVRSRGSTTATLAFFGTLIGMVIFWIALFKYMSVRVPSNKQTKTPNQAMHPRPPLSK